MCYSHILKIKLQAQVILWCLWDIIMFLIHKNVPLSRFLEPRSWWVFCPIHAVINYKESTTRNLVCLRIHQLCFGRPVLLHINLWTARVLTILERKHFESFSPMCTWVLFLSLLIYRHVLSGYMSVLTLPLLNGSWKRTLSCWYIS